jgi:hypothetical protein
MKPYPGINSKIDVPDRYPRNRTTGIAIRTSRMNGIREYGSQYRAETEHQGEVKAVEERIGAAHTIMP